MTSPTRLMAALLPVVLGLAASACGHAVLGQRIPAQRLRANPADFAPEPDVAVLHYYGVGGWGILWKGSYLLAAPYFSNHGYLDSSVCEAVPDEAAIAKGFRGTPYEKTSVILVGHGHVDHASDIPAYPFGAMCHPPTLIADASTIRLLGDATRARVCAIPLRAEDAGVTLPTEGECRTGDFRIRPLPWAHAAHYELPVGDARVTVGDPQGTQDTDLAEPPTRGNDWLVGRTWAFLIELLDQGEVVFRIHYVDSAANPSFVGAQAPLTDPPTDVHIACMPGFDLVEGYPERVIDRYHVKYVLTGHWEDFFRDRDRSLRPVTVLDDAKMGAFVRRVEGAIHPLDPWSAPINKGCCQEGVSCGPSGPSWTVPIPGETFWFHTAKSVAPGGR